MNPQKKQVTILGAKISYWIYNPEQTTTILMIHGFRGTHHGLEQIVKHLPEYRCIVPDLPGFGESSPLDAEHNLGLYIKFVREIIRTLQLKQPVLLGHSFGSIVASHFAAETPAAISKLILINPIGAPALEGPRGILTRLTVVYYVVGRILPDRASRAWLSTPLIVKIMSVTMAKTKDKATRAFIHDQHLTHFSTFANSKVLDQTFKTSVKHTVKTVAPKIAHSTLLIVGERDDITSLTKQHELHRLFSSSQLVALADVGHLIHYEKPAEAADAIKNFLNE